jgi:hypothetical protein
MIRPVVTLFTSFALLSACQPFPGAIAPGVATGQVVTGPASLSVRASLDGYRTQSAVSAYTRSNIAHLVLKLYVVTVVNGAEQETEALRAPGQPIELENVDLDKAVTFTGLKPHTTYRVKAFAYKAAGRDARHLISTQDATSAVTVTLTDETRPEGTTLRVRLRDRGASLKPLGGHLAVGFGRNLVSRAMQGNAKIAYNSRTGESLAVWEDQRNGAHDIYGCFLGANGQPSGEDFAITIDSSYQLNPAVAYSSGANAYLVTWQDNRNSSGNTDIYGQWVQAGSAPAPANNFPIANAPAPQTGPALAYNSATGEFLVTWQDYRNNGTSGLDIYAQRVSDNATPNPADNVAVCTATGAQDKTTVAYNSAANEWLVAWDDKRRDGTTVDLYARRVGATSQPEQRVLEGSAIAGLTTPRLAYNPPSDTYLLTYKSGNAVLAQRLSEAGEPAGSPSSISANAFQHQVAASPVADEFFIVYFESDRRVCGQRIGPVGGEANVPVVIDPGMSNDNPAVAYSGQAGVYTVTYTKEPNEEGSFARDINYLRVGPSGAAAAQLLSPAGAAAVQAQPSVAYSPSRRTYLAVWEDDRRHSSGESDLYARFLNEDGTPAGADFLLAEVSQFDAAPTVIHNATDDTFLVVWTSLATLNAVRVPANGSPPAARITFATGLAPGRPAIAHNSQANEYLVTWMDSYAGARSILGQRLNPDGSAKGAVVVIDASGDSPDQPAVAYNPKANGYLVAWAPGTTDRRIHARRLSGAGVPDAAGRFPLSSRSTTQVHPAVAYHGGLDQFLVAWVDDQVGYGFISAQRVGASGVPDPTTDLRIADRAENNAPPSVVGLQQTGEFLVTWGDRRLSGLGADLYGQRVGAAAPDPATAFMIAGLSGDQRLPAAAYNGSANECLVLWQDHRGGINTPDIYAQRFDSYVVD